MSIETLREYGKRVLKVKEEFVSPVIDFKNSILQQSILSNKEIAIILSVAYIMKINDTGLLPSTVELSDTVKKYNERCAEYINYFFKKDNSLSFYCLKFILIKIEDHKYNMCLLKDLADRIFKKNENIRSHLRNVLNK
jgi:hypothetical protein